MSNYYFWQEQGLHQCKNISTSENASKIELDEIDIYWIVVMLYKYSSMLQR